MDINLEITKYEIKIRNRNKIRKFEIRNRKGGEIFELIISCILLMLQISDLEFCALLPCLEFPF